MSLDFKLHYDLLRAGDPTKPEVSAASNEEDAFYEGPSHVRNLCLVWPNGKRHFLSYAYLIGGQFTPSDEANVIVLDFSAYVVTVKGYKLQPLFVALIEQRSRHIVQIDTRYVEVFNEYESKIIEILIQPKSP